MNRDLAGDGSAIKIKALADNGTETRTKALAQDGVNRTRAPAEDGNVTRIKDPRADGANKSLRTPEQSKRALLSSGKMKLERWSSLKRQLKDGLQKVEALEDGKAISIPAEDGRLTTRCSLRALKDLRKPEKVTVTTKAKGSVLRVMIKKAITKE